MVSSPILWSGRYGCEKNQKFSWTLRIPYPGVSPPDTRLIILLIPGRCSLTCQALSHTLHRWSAVGELRVSDQGCLACTAGAEEAEHFSLLNLKVNTLQCDNVSGPGLLSRVVTVAWFPSRGLA